MLIHIRMISMKMDMRTGEILAVGGIVFVSEDRAFIFDSIKYFESGSFDP